MTATNTTYKTYAFGVGRLYLTPVGGGQTTQISTALQNASFDVSFEEKLGYGNSQWPLASGRGKAKGSGKISLLGIDGPLLATVLAGSTTTTGRLKGVSNETGTVPGSSTYTITVTHGSTFANDCGVVYAATGLPLAFSTTGPAAGQYNVNTTTGVYTFASGDASANLLISYEWTDTSGATIAYTNPLMGIQTTYTLGLWNTEPDGTLFGMKLYAVTISKLALPFKNEDFTLTDVDFSILANSTGKVWDAYVP